MAMNEYVVGELVGVRPPWFGGEQKTFMGVIIEKRDNEGCIEYLVQLSPRFLFLAKSHEDIVCRCPKEVNNA